jgi:hypothetical protein
MMFGLHATDVDVTQANTAAGGNHFTDGMGSKCDSAEGENTRGKTRKSRQRDSASTMRFGAQNQTWQNQT